MSIVNDTWIRRNGMISGDKEVGRIRRTLGEMQRLRILPYVRVDRSFALEASTYLKQRKKRLGQCVRTRELRSARPTILVRSAPPARRSPSSPGNRGSKLSLVGFDEVSISGSCRQVDQGVAGWRDPAPDRRCTRLYREGEDPHLLYRVHTHGLGRQVDPSR